MGAQRETVSSPYKVLSLPDQATVQPDPPWWTTYSGQDENPFERQPSETSAACYHVIQPIETMFQLSHVASGPEPGMKVYILVSTLQSVRLQAQILSKVPTDRRAQMRRHPYRSIAGLSSRVHH